MNVNDMLKELHKAVNVPDNEVMALPFGNSNPDEVISWIVSLSDEDFSLLMKTPIINQAKEYYKNVRTELRSK